jgi:type VI secretion system protein ImpJ
MKPHWPRTLQLFPAHLQAQDTHVEELVSLRAARVAALSYGVLDMVVDEGSLAKGLIVFSKLHALFPSGLVFESGKFPVRRDASSALAGAAGPVGLFVGLPRLAARGPNVTEDDGVDRSMRYVSQKKTSPWWLRPRPELLFEHEPVERFEAVALGRIERIGKGLHFVRSAFPTMARIRAVQELKEAVKHLILALRKRRDELVDYRAEHPLSLKSIAYGELPALELLAILQRYLPLLAELYLRRSTHPHELYETLVALHGALYSFGAQEAAAPYMHDKLGSVLPPLLQRIEVIVDEAARDTTTVLPFKRADANTFRLSFKHEDMVGKRPFLVASGADEGFLRDRLPNVLKMASPEAIAPLLQSALRGVAVAVEFEPPAVLPRRPDVVAYRINVRDAKWLDIEDRKQIELHVPHAPSTLEFRLYGVTRGL